MRPVILYTDVDKEMVERVAEYLGATLNVCRNRVKVIEHPDIMNPRVTTDLYSHGQESWRYIDTWAAVVCTDRVSGYSTWEGVRSCVDDFLAGWKLCKAEWEKVEELRHECYMLTLRFREEKGLKKANFNPKECLECGERVHCLTTDITEVYKLGRPDLGGLPCIVMARINNWEFEDEQVIQLHLGGEWRKISQLRKSKEPKWFITNKFQLDHLRQEAKWGSSQRFKDTGVQFFWVRPRD